MPQSVLGISAYYHDAAACLIVDGRIAAAAQEERFTRKKHDERFPSSAVAYCLKEAGLTASTSEANRKIDEGAVRIDGERVTDRGLVLLPGADHVLQLGAKRFARVKLEAKA